MPQSAKPFRINGDDHAERRENANTRGYTWKWRQVSKAWLALPENMFCIDCKADGRDEFATVVDHEVPHRGDQNLFWDQANWRPRCKRHHDRKTGRGR